MILAVPLSSLYIYTCIRPHEECYILRPEEGGEGGIQDVFDNQTLRLLSYLHIHNYKYAPLVIIYPSPLGG